MFQSVFSLRAVFFPTITLNHQQTKIVTMSSYDDKTEKREKRFRSKVTKPVADRIPRAANEKFVVVKKSKVIQTDEDYCCCFEIAGSTGNVYDVEIGRLPSCTCPDWQKRKDCCKHTLFVLMKIVGLDREHELLYQRAFVSSELDYLFKKMKKNKRDAKRYFLSGEKNDVDGLVSRFATTNIEDDGGHYEYRNVRTITGQSASRDKSTYRPYHWQRPPYIRYN